jgi:cleavage and polyadenylation specificity factor subunit 3
MRLTGHSFHIDHAASLPYVLAKTNFRGRVFMTHPTKAIYKWLIQDSVRVGNTSSNPTTQLVYTEQDHLNTFPQIEAIDYYTTHTISSIRITPYPAGHVLGAAMFLIEIAGLNIFFTGDYSREQDRHLVSAEVPKGVKIDVLITESTYGIASHVPRMEREQALMKSITSILNRGGRALLPVFALGRAQELLLILDEYWAKHQDFQKFPIYYASNLARKCMLVYQTYVGAMNDNIKRLFRERMAEAEAAGNGAGNGGPWDFKYIRSLKNLDRFDDVGGCVMLASPGMLQNGASRELLERWAPNEKNGVIITGYSVEGTMARQIMQEPDQIPAVMSRSIAGARRAPGGDSEKLMIPRRCSIQEYSFAAHVDGVENREFIEEVAAPVVVSFFGPSAYLFCSSILPCLLTDHSPADPRPRRAAQHDAPQIEAPISQQHQKSQNKSLLPTELRGATHPFQSRQDCQGGRQARINTAATAIHGRNGTRSGFSAARHRCTSPERLQAVPDGSRGPARVRRTQHHDHYLPPEVDAQRRWHRSDQVGSRGNVWRR